MMYLILTPEFCQRHHGYREGVNEFNYSVTVNGEYVAAINSIAEFPVLFSNTTATIRDIPDSEFDQPETEQVPQQWAHPAYPTRVYITNNMLATLLDNGYKILVDMAINNQYPRVRTSAGFVVYIDELNPEHRDILNSLYILVQDQPTTNN